MAQPQDTVEWREALALLAQWQDAPAEQREPLLQRLCEEHPATAAVLRRLADSLRHADAEGFLTRNARPFGAHLVARAGSVCGRWTLEHPLGSGGMGEVWRARRNDGLHEGMAAIKLLHAGPRTALTEARFAAEGRVLARLEHPHIARLLDVGIDTEGQRYIVLEHVAGEPITAWCSAHRTPLAGRLGLFLQVCDAVAHAHAQLVVHRDIKPSNILVTADGQAKLLDFGIAKLLDDESGDLTLGGQPVLTPDYAAPEQLLGGPVSVATDVHALGSLLFELLTGARPHGNSDATPEQRLRAALDGEARRPSRVADATLAALLRGDLDHIVERALRRQPAERYPSVRSLADDVQRHVRHEPVSVRAPSWRYRTAKFVRRHRAGVVGGSFAVLALLAGSGAALWQSSRAQEAARQAREEAAVANATREFLLGLFRTVDVGATGTGDQLNRSIRDLLIDGGQRLLDNRDLSPAVRLDLLSTIGQLHSGLSLSDSAERMESEALRLAREIHGPDSDITLQAMIERGTSLTALRRNAEAFAMLSEVLSTTERLGRTDSLIHVRALHELGESAFMTEDERAVGFLKRAIAGYASRYPNHLERVPAHVMLMLWHSHVEDFAAFDREALRTEELVRRTASERTYDRSYLDRTQASRWLAVGDYPRARALLLSAVTASIESLGGRHPLAIRVQRQLALVDHQLGDRDAALQRLTDIDDTPQDAAVWSAKERDQSWRDLAWLDGNLGLARVSALRVLGMPPGHSDEQASRLVRWAEIEALAGRASAAVAAARSAIEQLRSNTGAGGLMRVQARAALAESLLIAARHDEARLEFAALLDWAEVRKAAPAGPLVGRLRARALLGLSAALRSSDPAAALTRAIEALDGLSAEAPALDDRLLWSAARIAQAQALLGLGRRREAAAAAASAIAQLERDQAPASPRLAHARAVLATMR